jgi:hypothetical protein
MCPNYRDWNYEYTTKGLIKKQTKAVLRIAVLAGGATGLYLAHQAGLSVPGWKESVANTKSIAVHLLHIGALALMRVAGQIE